MVDAAKEEKSVCTFFKKTSRQRQQRRRRQSSSEGASLKEFIFEFGAPVYVLFRKFMEV